jgi:hypothetical protein
MLRSICTTPTVDQQSRILSLFGLFFNAHSTPFYQTNYILSPILLVRQASRLNMQQLEAKTELCAIYEDHELPYLPLRSPPPFTYSPVHFFNG